ncbi:Flp pilus assembly complex ATPase component TadA [Candidatus Uhrbacteria bacterium]|nr:Flp pilus assembly complex ATPase component TadA [Candidatus Uhrbacteria bacterium]
MEDAQLKKILLAGNYVSERDLANAQDDAIKNHRPIADYLFSEGLLTKDIMGQAIAESLDVPYADLNSNQPPREQVLKIPEETAKKFHAVLFDQSDVSVSVASDAPTEKGLSEALTPLFPNKKIVLLYSLFEDIATAHTHYQKSLDTRFSKILEKKHRIAPELLDEIFLDSLTFHASDIHFDPQAHEVVVRFRIDGVLHEAGRFPREHYPNILNRVKVMSAMRIDEHFAAQDGSLQFIHDEKAVDMRTSIAPTIQGEKVVLRVLKAYVEGFALGDLGLSPRDQSLLEDAAHKPFGMIVVAGPTGSGKTTTLYSLIKSLNRAEINITTIEDPVEYRVPGINQIQVNPLTNLTFAKGLKSIVRQDPDMILVGEIRDEETAEIAVNAALTGHLLFSTFHANDAATAIPRLLDMGIEQFLLASTLELIIAQRLVRKICEQCRQSDPILAKDMPSSLAPHIESGKKKVSFYRGKGCDTCGQSGYHGRIGIFEFIRITPAMKELVLKHPSTQQVLELAREEGFRSLFEDGLEKARLGVTTIEELLRVAPPNPDTARFSKKKKKSAV